MSAARDGDGAGPPGGIRRAVQAALLAQVVLAAALAVAVWEPEPATDWAPATPGDQTRPFRPGVLPAPFRRPAAPTGPGPSLPGFEAPRAVIEAAARDEGGTRLMLSGNLAAGDAARLADALDAAEAPVTLALHSPGGLVGEALEMGRMVRAEAVATEIPQGAACLSACPLVFAGGVTRAVAEGAWLGLHQSYHDQSTLLPAFLAVEQIQYGQGAVLRFLHEMGIDPMVMVHALETPPEDIYVLTPAEQVRYGFVTGDTEGAPHAD